MKMYQSGFIAQQILICALVGDEWQGLSPETRAPGTCTHEEETG